MRITSSGVIYCFQFFIFFNVLVEGLVLLTLAATIAKFFAYNCLGERSTVLRNTCFEGTAECLTAFNELSDLGRASREQTETQAASKRQRFASGVADKMLRQQGGTSGARAAPRLRSLTLRSMRSDIESMRSDTTVVATFASVAAAAEAAAAEPAAEPATEPAAEPATVAATSVSASALAAASVRVRVAVLCE